MLWKNQPLGDHESKLKEAWKDAIENVACNEMNSSTQREKETKHQLKHCFKQAHLAIRQNYL